MNARQTTSKLCRMPALLALAFPLAAGSAAAATYDLVAMPFDKPVPAGSPSTVPMWGFALDGAAPVPTVPGPPLVVPPNETSLTINLRNTLPEPVSIVIPGQAMPVTGGSSAPVKFSDGQGRQRARSFTAEAAALGGVQTYTWNNLKPGTYLYHSGSHPQVQVQMGLYGAMTHDALAGNAYAGVPYASQLTLLFSEIDPALHEAVGSGQYGPGFAMSSTIDYQPRWFLINGEPHTAASVPAVIGTVGEPTLLRLLNAGLQSRSPVLQGMHMRLVAEDGNLYPHVREQYSVFLPALKTVDAVITPTAVETFPVYDRRLATANPGINGSTAGGMLALLTVGDGTVPPNTAPSITSTAITTATVGVPYSYDVNATDPEGDALTYSLDAAPAGMTIDSTSGVISWTPAATGDSNVTVRATDTGGLSATQSFVVSVEPAATPVLLYFSTSANTAVPGTGGTADDADIYSWDGTSFARVLDATAVGLPSATFAANVDGLKVIGTRFYLSFSNSGVAVPGVGTVPDEDIVVYDSSTGTWSLFFDGSAVGLTTDDEDVDAFDILTDGSVLVSTLGNVTVPGLAGTWADEDVLHCTPSSNAPIASCTWSVHFDGSDVTLTNASEDVDGVTAAAGKLYLGTLGAYGVTGLSGGGGDVFSCDAPVTGTTSSCASFTLYFRASQHGLAGVLDAISVP